MTKLADKIITTTKAAQILGVAQSYIRQMILEGKIKAEKVGTDWMMTEKSLKNFKRQRKKSVRENKDDAGKLGL